MIRIVRVMTSPARGCVPPGTGARRGRRAFLRTFVDSIPAIAAHPRVY